MICNKCGQRFSPYYDHGEDLTKCEDCQPKPNSPDIEPEAELLPSLEQEYTLGGEA